MKAKTIRKSSIGIALLVSGLAATAQTPPTLKVLYTFSRVGGTPTAFTEVSPGKFLGIIATSPGLFSITSDRTYDSLYYFPPNPSGITALGLAPALNSRTYGTATNMGPTLTFSELFAVATSGSVIIYPYQQASAGLLVQAPDNQLYGFYGAVGGPSQFSRFDYQGTTTPLDNFTPAQGTVYVLVLGADGNFYGLSLMNNTTNAGIFRLTAKGSFSWVVPSFSTGTYGVAGYRIGLIQASNGKFYGTVPQGGSANAGSIYEADLNGNMRTVYEFPQLTGGIPETLLQASDGMLYGTARGPYLVSQSSSIFRLNPSTGEFTTIYGPLGPNQGSCECQMIQASHGKPYGVAQNGGTYGGGTVFMLDAGLPPPKPSVGLFVPSSGSAAQRILLWGRNLLGATAVAFNGTAAAQFQVASNQGIWVDVPPGATIGPITVTTPNGSYTTPQTFQIQ
jgi:uncharacterized repeat protein (TIGR03803 family)